MASNKLILKGVSKLKTLGYKHVNENNILTDQVYRIFFKKILRELLNIHKSEVKDIQILLDKINIGNSSLHE